MQDSIKLWASQILQDSVTDLTQIADPEFMGRILSTLDSSFFTASPSIDDSLDEIYHYYRNNLYIDVAQAIKNIKTERNILRIWELVLGIAIKCPDRNKYIQLIMNLDEVSMASLMVFINKVEKLLGQPSNSKIKASQIGDDQDFERTLLATMDELTQENNYLKDRINDYEQQLANLKQEEDEAKKQLQREVQLLRAERLEVLEDFEIEGTSASLLEIFKGLQNENLQLKAIVDNHNRAIASMEKMIEETNLKNIVLKEQNKEMKREYDKIQQLQKELEDAQLVIKDLRESENKYLERIFELEETRAHLRQRIPMSETPHLTDTGLTRTDSMMTAGLSQPEPAQTRGGSVYYKRHQEVTRKVHNIPGFSKKFSLEGELKPYVAEQEALEKVRELQTKLQQVNETIQEKDGTVEELKVKIKNKEECIQGLQQKVAKLEKLVDLYSQNLREKQENSIEKEEEYQIKFQQLIANIKSLKEAELQDRGKVVQIEMKNSENSKTMQSQYEKRLEEVFKALEKSLVEFRDKQLDYLQKIRKLNGQIQKMNERIKASQETQIMVAASSADSSQHIRVQRQKQLAESIRDLEVRISEKERQIKQAAQKIEQSMEREVGYVKQIQSLKATNNKLASQNSIYKAQMLKYLEEILSQLESNRKYIQERNIYLKQHLQSQKQRQQSQEQSTTELLNKIQSYRKEQDKHRYQCQKQFSNALCNLPDDPSKTIVNYLNTQLQQAQQISKIVKLRDVKKHNQGADLSEQVNVLDETKINEIVSVVEVTKSVEEQKEDSIPDAEEGKKTLKISRISKQMTLQLQNTIQALTTRNTELLDRINTLNEQIYRLNKQIEGKSDSDQQVRKMAELILEIQRLSDEKVSFSQLIYSMQKEVEEKDALIEELRKSVGSDLSSAKFFKQRHQQLTEKMNAQSMHFQVFRRRYIQIYDKYKSVLDERDLLLGVIFQLRTDFKAFS